MQEAEQPKNILQMLVLYTSSKNVVPDDNVRIMSHERHPLHKGNPIHLWQRENPIHAE